METAVSLTEMQNRSSDRNSMNWVVVRPCTSTAHPDAIIESPLLDYVGDGTHISVLFAVSADGSIVEGIALGTTTGPGIGATFSGTTEGPAIPVFSTGSFGELANLLPGSVDLAPRDSWNGGIRVMVVPEPATTLALAMFGLVGVGWQRRRRATR